MTGHDWETETLDPVRQRPACLDGDAGAHVRFLDPREPSPEPHSDSVGFAGRVSPDTDRLLYLTSGGPDAGCQQLVVDGVTRTDGGLSVDARVECEPGMVAQVVTYPASVLWVPDAAVDRVTARVTDGWQQSHAVEATAGGES